MSPPSSLGGPETPAWSATVRLVDEAATVALAELLGPLLPAGTLLCLSGELGAGKTTFARALIRILAGNPGLEVPSPTFTLVQAYAEATPPVSHFDLYRLADPSELDELGLDDAVLHGIALVEWPERAPDALSAASLSIVLQTLPSGRLAIISGNAEWSARLAVRLSSFGPPSK